MGAEPECAAGAAAGIAVTKIGGADADADADADPDDVAFCVGTCAVLARSIVRPDACPDACPDVWDVIDAGSVAGGFWVVAAPSASALPFQTAPGLVDAGAVAAAPLLATGAPVEGEAEAAASGIEAATSAGGCVAGDC
jgi:hypothetical protein